MLSKLRVALIGCGHISRKYAECLTGQLDGVELTAVCDLDPLRAGEFASQYGVQSYSSISQMVDQAGANIDVFAVLTPSGVHAANILELVELGARNIIVEKPIALCLRDATGVVDACEASGTRLFVVKQWRFNRAVQAMRNALELDRFGKLSLLTTRLRWCRHAHYYQAASWRGTWAQDGGVLTNQACHALDLMLWFGGEVEKVYAMCQTRLADIEAEDTAVAVVHFANGALGAIEATTATRPGNLEASFTVLGDGGSAEVAGNSADSLRNWRFEEEEEEDGFVLQHRANNPEDVSNYAHCSYLEDVFTSIREDREGGVSGREALEPLRLIHALYESDRCGMPVVVHDHDFSSSRLGRSVAEPEATAVR